MPRNLALPPSECCVSLPFCSHPAVLGWFVPGLLPHPPLVTAPCERSMLRCLHPSSAPDGTALPSPWLRRWCGSDHREDWLSLFHTSLCRWASDCNLTLPEQLLKSVSNLARLVLAGSHQHLPAQQDVFSDCSFGSSIQCTEMPLRVYENLNSFMQVAWIVVWFHWKSQ